ncbi:MAG: tyrosine-type recombinase/integrase [Thermoflexales bacterium]|nr:tyrosine-type recombinase/integrase [Thermoflexales bacterium]
MFGKILDQFDAHLGGLSRAPNTRAAYKRDLIQFLAFAEAQGVTALSDLTAAHVSAWLAELAEAEQSASSRARKFNTLRSFTKYLLLVGQIIPDRVGCDFTLGIDPPKPKSKEPRVLTQTQIKALQGVAHNDPRNAAIVEVLLQTGLRVGELTSLTLDDLVWGDEYTQSYLLIRKAKGGKERCVSVNSVAEEALRRWLKVRPKNKGRHLFLSKRGAMPLFSADVRAMLKRYYKAAGISTDGISAHTLRHTFCTQHAAKGTNLIVIQRAAGHASLTTTQHYLHLVDKMMEEELERNAL